MKMRSAEPGSMDSRVFGTRGGHEQGLRRLFWLVTGPKLTGRFMMGASILFGQSCKRVTSRKRVYVPAALTTADWPTAMPLERSTDVLSLPCRAHTPAG